MRHVKLTAQEKEIEDALLKGEYFDASKSYFDEVAEVIASRKKDAVLNVRVNSSDLKHIKEKASRLGIKYQTFISEILHRVAHS